MKTLKLICWSSLLLFSASLLPAQSCIAPYPNISNDKVEKVVSGNDLATVKQLYAAFSKGDVLSIRNLLAEEVNWNGQANFPYVGRDPHIGKDFILSSVFDRFRQGWHSWTLHDLQFDVKEDGKIVVKGLYRAKYRQTDFSSVDFAHTLQIAHGQITYFAKLDLNEYVSY
ncbi:MAG: hypothetical protein AAF849_07145 [Bacteroidota bacterium]